MPQPRNQLFIDLCRVRDLCVMSDHRILFSSLGEPSGRGYAFALDPNVEPLGSDLDNGEFPVATQETAIAIGGRKTNIWLESHDDFSESIK